MEHQDFHYIGRFKDKLVENVDLLMFVFFIFFTMASIVLEKTFLIWLPIFTSTWACYGLREMMSRSKRQYNRRKLMVLLYLFVYYTGFLIFQKLGKTTPDSKKQMEEVTMLIYVVFWFFITSFLDVIEDRFWLTVILIFSWIPATIGLVLLILCYEGYYKGENCGRQVVPWIVLSTLGNTLMVIFTYEF